MIRRGRRPPAEAACPALCAIRSGWSTARLRWSKAVVCASCLPGFSRSASVASGCGVRTCRGCSRAHRGGGGGVIAMLAARVLNRFSGAAARPGGLYSYRHLSVSSRAEWRGLRKPYGPMLDLRADGGMVSSANAYLDGGLAGPGRLLWGSCGVATVACCRRPWAIMGAGTAEGAVGRGRAARSGLEVGVRLRDSGQDRGPGQYRVFAGRVPVRRNVMVVWSAQFEPVP